MALRRRGERLGVHFVNLCPVEQLQAREQAHDRVAGALAAFERVPPCVQPREPRGGGLQGLERAPVTELVVVQVERGQQRERRSRQALCVGSGWVGGDVGRRRRWWRWWWRRRVVAAVVALLPSEVRKLWLKSSCTRPASVSKEWRSIETRPCKGEEEVGVERHDG